ncbi:MAG TPA: hypothetical protein VMN78_06160 [Longimicrobiales bacterium]|nr:hypothetical protein [Longimicrobiales bacterium]
MKATIDFDEALYRRLKIEAARRGRTIRELVDEGVRRVLGLPFPEGDDETRSEDWFASLSEYAANAGDDHSLEGMRGSIARGRARRS